MRGWVIAGVLALGLLLSATLATDPAENGGEGGFAALDTFLTLSPLAGKDRVLGMVGFYGQPQPVQWLILTGDPASPNPLRETVFARGRVLAERKFPPLPGQDLPHLPILRETLKIDSGAAFHIAEARAKARKTPFDRAHFQLRVRDEGAEPVWMLNLIDTSQVSVGLVYLSARSGEILRETWVRPPAIPEEGISAR